MPFSKRAIAVLLAAALTVATVRAFGQSEEKPAALGGKSKSETEITKKKFPWLLVGGIVAAGIVVVVIFSKKKKTATPPAPGRGAIHVESTPAGAKIYLNDTDIGATTDTTVLGVAQGNHSIRLVLSGYNDYVQSVVVEAEHTAEVSATLTEYVVQEPEMIRLPGGTFMMGSESGEALVDEKPVHQVTLSSFEIGKYEVTQEEWRSVMGSNPSYFRGARLPVEKLTWLDVQAYIQKLNQATGKRYRLPTEAEWEYACRAGTTGDRYGEPDSIAWYSRNSDGRTHEVGGKAPNAFGLYDMLGNVYEWCAECYGPYSPEPAINPRGNENCAPDESITNSHHLVRGGSWLQNATAARAPFRNIHWHHDDLLGFRLARD